MHWKGDDFDTLKNYVELTFPSNVMNKINLNLFQLPKKIVHRLTRILTQRAQKIEIEAGEKREIRLFFW